MQPQRGRHAGRPLRSSLVAHGSWLPAGALLSAHLAFTAFGDRDLLAAIVLGVATVVVYLFCAVIHALAHIVAAALTTSGPLRLRLFVFGDAPRDPTKRGVGPAITALAGPIASAALGGVLLLIAAAARDWPADILKIAAWSSLGLAALNLVPGLPLDAGRVLRSFTATDRGPRAFGSVAGLAAVAIGIWLLIGAVGALDDTAFGLWLLVAGIFILVEGRSRGLQTPIEVPSIDGETIGQWARPFAGRLLPTDPVPLDGAPYAVADGQRLAGIVPSGRRSKGARTADVMVPWTSEISMRADVPLRRAIERLSGRDTEVIVVVDERGVVRGVLDEAAVRQGLGR